MASLAEVIAHIRSALDLADQNINDMLAVRERALEISRILREVGEGSSRPDFHEVSALFARLADATESCLDLKRTSVETVTHYLRRIGATADGDTRADHPPDQLLAPRPPAAAPLPLGRWQGLTAAEHARDRGTRIGREPRRKRRMQIREVPDAAELRRIYEALTINGRLTHVPGYKGVVSLLPDGTCVGWRPSSSSTPGEPTIDLWTTDNHQLKIHVNKQGWNTI
ncbi:hypothetical protein [Goodfellowiella coeruleoviolacea]|uniref:Uncharacterized protein n=1 Tax=Goodfellowiella coeruleoviolacea TaxID=334858 RepID=A0AAE3GCP9_9PSEU|nr:hypothetical protein [Goodfellowiella coeruleoviolacea]MCP2164744.1 hypothetical protein [Goodfellowiella coeruleoviolacea]